MRKTRRNSNNKSINYSANRYCCFTDFRTQSRHIHGPVSAQPNSTALSVLNPLYSFGNLCNFNAYAGKIFINVSGQLVRTRLIPGS